MKKKEKEAGMRSSHWVGQGVLCAVSKSRNHKGKAGGGGWGQGRQAWAGGLLLLEHFLWVRLGFRDGLGATGVYLHVARVLRLRSK